MGWRDVLRRGDAILVALSGGSDSVGLLVRLAAEAPAAGWTLHVAHVNHHLPECRPEELAARSARLATEFGLGFSLLHIRDEELRSREGVSSSLEARLSEERLRMLKQEARRVGARALALGHTADDAAETLLLMALRGAGPRGLGALREVLELEGEGLVLIRPLLGERREAIRADLRARGIAWLDDPMNATPKVRRNRVRHEVVPRLEAIEPAAVELLARVAGLCSEESMALEALLEPVLRRCRVSAARGSVVLDVGRLAECGPAVARAVVRSAWMAAACQGEGAGRIGLPPPRALVEDLLDRALSSRREEAAFGPARGFGAWTAGPWALLAFGAGSPPWSAHAASLMSLLLLPDAKPCAVLNASQRHTPGRYEMLLPEGQGRLVAEVSAADAFAADWTSEPFTSHRAAAFDCRSIRRDLVLRPLEAEDRLAIGGGQHKTGAAVMQEAHVPAALRARVAVLADDRGPLWVPGLRRAASAVITPRTELVLLLTWHPSPKEPTA
jgi:tRNA(Ile)-lysidine synthase